MGLQNVVFAITDIETTGLFPNRHDKIIEIAVVRINAAGTIIDEYHTLINPQRDIGPTHIHGLKARDVKNAPLFKDVVGDVVSLLSGSIFTAHNVSFDKRFLESELNHAGYIMPEYPYLDTMQLAKKTDPDIPSRKLAELCHYFDILHERVHSALDDARATANLLAICISKIGGIENLSYSDIGVRGRTAGKYLWPQIPVSGKSLSRRKSLKQEYETPYLARLVAKLPTTTELTTECEEYLALLDRVLEDRRVTAEEAKELLDLSSQEGLSREQVVKAHRTYMTDLLLLAWEDRVVTNAEKNDLEDVRRLLGISPEDYQALFDKIEKETAAGCNRVTTSIIHSKELAGNSICFTGIMTCKINGKLAERSYAEKIANDRGMIVLDRCTKKLDYLVAADTDSMSGKAKKARNYGVRIIAEPAFWIMMGISIE